MSTSPQQISPHSYKQPAKFGTKPAKEDSKFDASGGSSIGRKTSDSKIGSHQYVLSHDKITLLNSKILNYMNTNVIKYA